MKYFLLFFSYHMLIQCLLINDLISLFSERFNGMIQPVTYRLIFLIDSSSHLLMNRSAQVMLYVLRRAGRTL